MRLHLTNYKILIGDLINSWHIKICPVYLIKNWTFKKLKTYVYLIIISIKKPTWFPKVGFLLQLFY
jgi:hypothetical protein